MEDYAGDDTKSKGLAMIDRELEKIPNEKVRQIAKQHLTEISEGKSDFRF